MALGQRGIPWTKYTITGFMLDFGNCPFLRREPKEAMNDRWFRTIKVTDTSDNAGV